MTLLGIRILFLPCHPGFTYKCHDSEREQGLGQVSFFPEINENSESVSLKSMFQEYVKNGRKSLAFIHNNCICLLEDLY